MSTSYMNYAEKLNLPKRPQSPSNTGTPSTPTTVPHSFAPSQSPYKAYSLYSPSPPPYSPQPPQTHGADGDPASTNRRPDAQQYTPYVPPTPVHEKYSVPLGGTPDTSYSFPAQVSNQSVAANSSSKSQSPRPDTHIYTPYIPPASVDNIPSTSAVRQPSAPHSSPSLKNDLQSALRGPSTPVNHQSSMQSYASSASSTPLYEQVPTHSISPASASHVSSPLSALNTTSAPASRQSYAAHELPTSTTSPSSNSHTARNSAYENPNISTSCPPATHNILLTPVIEKLPLTSTSQQNDSYVSASQGKSQPYATNAPTYNQPNIPYIAPSSAHERRLSPTTPQSPSSNISSAPTNSPLGFQCAPSAPFTSQPDVSDRASMTIHNNPLSPSASSTSKPHLPPPPPNNQQGSPHAASNQDQRNLCTCSTSWPGTQSERSSPTNIQQSAISGTSVPVSSQSIPSYAGPQPPPPPSTVSPPPAYKPHDGYFTMRPVLAQILTPPITRHDPSPMNHTFSSVAQSTPGLTSPTSPFPYTPKLTPTSGTEPTIPMYNPQCMNQAYVPVAPNPSLASPPEQQYLQPADSTPAGASTPQFPLPPQAVVAMDEETKSSWGKRFVGNMLITRGIRAGVTSVASSVKLPAMLSPWGDNNPVTLPNMRRRDVVLLAGSHFGADAIVSGSLKFAGGLLVDAMRCVSQQVVDQAILDRIRFEEAKILRTTSVKSLQITIKHQLMGVDADLRFFGERFAPLTLLSCAKGWFCPYLYASGRTPTVPRSQNFSVAQCFGPFLNGNPSPHPPHIRE